MFDYSFPNSFDVKENFFSLLVEGSSNVLNEEQRATCEDTNHFECMKLLNPHAVGTPFDSSCMIIMTILPSKEQKQ